MEETILIVENVGYTTRAITSHDGHISSASTDDIVFRRSSKVEERACIFIVAVILNTIAVLIMKLLTYLGVLQ